MKFDVVVMNPPYQPIVERGKELGDGGSGSGCTLWDKFVPLALGLLNDGGHLCCVHPAKWRKPDDKLLPVFMGKRLLHLDIHNKHEGLRVFGATTRFDWYVLQNSPRNGTATTVRDEKGIIRRVDLGELPFIPNADFDLVARLLARDEDEKCRLLYDGATYDRRRPWMNTDQTGEFVYPCVNATGKAGLRCYYSNTRDKGLFGIPKVIFSDADIIANAVVDCEGEYGMTQHGMAIRIDSKREGQQGVGERPI